MYIYICIYTYIYIHKYTKKYVSIIYSKLSYSYSRCNR